MAEHASSCCRGYGRWTCVINWLTSTARTREHCGMTAASRDNQLMDRYVLFHAQGLDPKVLMAAKKTARALGATVVRAAAGSMLLEAAPIQIAEVATALPGWRHCVETKSHRLPEHRPLQRSR